MVSCSFCGTYNGLFSFCSYCSFCSDLRRVVLLYGRDIVDEVLNKVLLGGVSLDKDAVKKEQERKRKKKRKKRKKRFKRRLKQSEYVFLGRFFRKNLFYSRRRKTGISVFDGLGKISALTLFFLCTRPR